MQELPPPIIEWHHICEENVPKYGAVIIYVNNGTPIYWKYTNPDELIEISHKKEKHENTKR